MNPRVIPYPFEGLTDHKVRRIQKQEIFRNKHQKLFKALTKREIEIFSLLVHGLNNPRIADHLFISRNTVEQHRKNINRKLEITSFSHLFLYALAFDIM